MEISGTLSSTFRGSARALDPRLPSVSPPGCFARTAEDDAGPSRNWRRRTRRGLSARGRGPMRLHLADIHLHRARLFRGKEELKRARALIEQCGYWRCKQELEDAEEAAKSW